MLSGSVHVGLVLANYTLSWATHHASSSMAVEMQSKKHESEGETVTEDASGTIVDVHNSTYSSAPILLMAPLSGYPPMYAREQDYYLRRKTALNTPYSYHCVDQSLY